MTAKASPFGTGRAVVPAAEQIERKCGQRGERARDVQAIVGFRDAEREASPFARRELCDDCANEREAIKRLDHGKETLAEIGRSYNVSGWTILRLAK